MRFNKEDVGVYIEGATLYNPTEQNVEIVRFAHANGFDCNIDEVNKVLTEEDGWSYDDHEQFGWLVEDALDYLNTVCCEEGVAFTFRDTDFVLIDYNGLDND